MATKAQKTAQMLVLSACGCFFVVLGAYLWQHDYNIRPKDSGAGIPNMNATKPTRKIENAQTIPEHLQSQTKKIYHLEVRLEDGPLPGSATQEGKGKNVHLLFTNTGALPVKLLDADAVGVLYALTLVGPGNQPIPLRFSDKTLKLLAQRCSQSTVELLPKRTLRVAIDLSKYFDLDVQGEYRLSVTYQPERFTQNRNLKNGLRGVIDRAYSAGPLKFEAGSRVPDQKVEQKPGAEKEPAGAQ